MIDFTNPADVMNQGQRIPIDTPEAFEATRQAAKAIYAASGRAWDADADAQFEHRVRGGQTPEQVTTHTLEDRKARFDE